MKNFTSQTRTGEVVVDCSVLYALLNYENDFFNRCGSCRNFFTKYNASSISCLKGLLSNVDLSTFTVHRPIVLIFNYMLRTSVSAVIMLPCYMMFLSLQSVSFCMQLEL